MLLILLGPATVVQTVSQSLTLPMAAVTTSSLRITEYGQVGRRFGLTPQQVGEVYAFLDQNAAQITDIAAQNRVNQNAFRAIARELGLRNYGVAPDRLIGAIRAKGADAAKFEQENAALRAQIASLTNPAQKNPAQSAIDAAEKAYAAGDLQRAQLALNSLLKMRWGTSSQAIAAYQGALSSAMELARSRGDLETLDGLVRDSDAMMARMEFEARIARWKNALSLAEAYFDQGMLKGDIKSLRSSVSVYRDKALPLVDRRAYPDSWAYTQSNLGKALASLGEREAGKVNLEAAITACSAAMEVYTRDHNALEWGVAQGCIGHASLRLGEREAGAVHLEQAVTALQHSLEGIDRKKDPLIWASEQTRLGAALLSLGGREQGRTHLDQAIAAFQSGSEEFPRKQQPRAWASAQVSLGTAWQILGDRLNDTVLLEKSIGAFQAALEENTRERVPLEWATNQMNLGAAYESLGQRQPGTVQLQKADEAFREALQERTRDRVPLEWANAKLHLAKVLALIADRNGDQQTLAEARDIVAETVPVMRNAYAENLLNWANGLDQEIRGIAGKHGWVLPPSVPKTVAADISPAARL